MNAVTLKLSYVARAFGQRVPNLTFVAVCAMVAAVGCGGDSGTENPVGAAGATAAAGTGTPSGAAGATTGAAGATTGAAGATTPTGAAGAATGAAGAATGAAGAATGAAGAAGAATGAAGAAMGAAGTAAGAAGMAAAGGTPTLSMIYDMVYVAHCAVCHGMNPGASNGMLGGIKNKQAFYDTLVGKPATAGCMGKGNYITAGQPSMSVLVEKISMDMPPCGARMPPGDVLQPEEIKMVTDWITAGAMNN